MIALALTVGQKAALVLLGGPFIALVVLAAFITRDARRHRQNLRRMAEADAAKKKGGE